MNEWKPKEADMSAQGIWEAKHKQLMLQKSVLDAINPPIKNENVKRGSSYECHVSWNLEALFLLQHRTSANRRHSHSLHTHKR